MAIPIKRTGYRLMSTQVTPKKRRTAGAPPGFERMAALSARIGFCPSAIYNWISNPDMGFPAAVKLGRNISLYPIAAVDAWLAKRGVAAPVQAGAA
jgi:predicted DNA-binding transcriptional regulator AlpA